MGERTNKSLQKKVDRIGKVKLKWYIFRLLPGILFDYYLQKYLVQPVKQQLYCDAINAPGRYKLSNISALSHYSALNPDGTTTVALTAGQWKARNESDFMNVNPLEGDFRIEIWQYPPIPTDKQYVDKLSLALSLQDDHDPRVEKEVELMIKQLW